MVFIFHTQLTEKSILRRATTFQLLFQPVSGSMKASATFSSSSSSSRRRGKVTETQCGVCGKVLSRSDNLKNHMRVHTGEEPYSCKYCGQKFKWPSGLRNHEDIHVVKMLRRKEASASASASRSNSELEVISKNKKGHHQSKEKRSHSEIFLTGNINKSRSSTTTYSSQPNNLASSVLPLLLTDGELKTDAIDVIEDF